MQVCMRFLQCINHSQFFEQYIWVQIIIMELGKAIFASQRTQELYDLLQSLKSPPPQRTESKKKSENKANKSVKQEPTPIMRVEEETPTNKSERKWTVQSSSSRGSTSNSKEKNYPYTSRQTGITKKLFFKSAAYMSNNNRDHIKVEDLDPSINQHPQTERKTINSQKKGSNKNKSKLKSRLFTKKQLQSVKESLDLELIIKRQHVDVYYNGGLPILLKCYQQRDWLNITDSLLNPRFLWASQTQCKNFISSKMKQLERHQQGNPKRHLISYLPIEIPKILTEAIVEKQNFSPIMLELKQFTQSKQILETVQHLKDTKAWILKPFQKANCSNSSICHNKQQLQEKINKLYKGKLALEYILQQYIADPFLYNERKFSIKAFLLVTHIENITKGFIYDKLRIQTSSLEYNINNKNVCVHFTGFQTQKQSKYFQKYEQSNLIQENDLKKYIQKTTQGTHKQERAFKQQIRDTAEYLTKRISLQLMKISKEINYFQVFGLDFIMNKEHKVILLSIEREPNFLLKHIKDFPTEIVQNVLKLTLDVHVPPTLSYYSKRDRSINYFDNIYDLKIDQLQRN